MFYLAAMLVRWGFRVFLGCLVALIVTIIVVHQYAIRHPFPDPTYPTTTVAP